MISTCVAIKKVKRKALHGVVALCARMRTSLHTSPCTVLWWDCPFKNNSILQLGVWAVLDREWRYPWRSRQEMFITVKRCRPRHIGTPEIRLGFASMLSTPPPANHGCNFIGSNFVTSETGIGGPETKGSLPLCLAVLRPYIIFSGSRSGFVVNFLPGFGSGMLSKYMLDANFKFSCTQRSLYPVQKI